MTGAGLIRWLAVIALGAASPAFAAEGVQYDCVLGDAYSIIKSEDGAFKTNAIRFGDGSGERKWTFTLIHGDGEAEIVWRDSPMQLSGKSPLLPTSDDSYAGFYVGRGPCLFTETNCGSTVHFADQPDGTLKIQIHPIALGSFEDGHGEPFVVYLDGTCMPKGGDK